MRKFLLFFFYLFFFQIDLSEIKKTNLQEPPKKHAAQQKANVFGTLLRD